MKITIDLPEELEFMKNIPSIYWKVATVKLLQEKMEEIAEIHRIVSKSQLTENDVEELTDKINNEISKHYSKYR